MFFEKLAPRKKSVLKALPPSPDTGWVRPSNFPNLVGNVRAVSIDVETKEPDFDHGPGWSRNCGHIVGFSVGVIGTCGSTDAWYFPLRHEVDAQANISPEQAFSWLGSVLDTPTVPKVGANLIYDIGWLGEENIKVSGPLFDVLFAESLLNENTHDGLEELGQKYCGEGKESSLLYEWCVKAYGGQPTSKQRENIYRAPPSLVGFYAESDASLPLRILDQQWPLLEEQGLGEVFRMECDLIPMWIAMRQTGIQVNLTAAEQLHVKLGGDIKILKEKFYSEAGMVASVDSADELSQVFDKLGLVYPRTKKTDAPSFKQKWLEEHPHPIAQSIVEIRTHEKIRNTFIESYILNKHVNQRIHCSFNPMRATTGRTSSDSPNLQNIPVRSDLGKLMRKMFIPDPGHVAIESADFSQIEYRLMAHFAVGPGSNDVRHRYNTDPTTDYHQMTHDLVLQMTGQDIERKPIKTINFGILYGMMVNSLSILLGIPKQEAKKLLEGYHTGNPYVKATMDWASNLAQKFGFVQTLMGRRRRFDLWEPVENMFKKKDERDQAMPYDWAINHYGSQIHRAMTYIAINTILQGSAADFLKKGMLDCWKAGIFDVIGVPKTQVHDELNFSVINHSPAQNEAYAEMKNIMESALVTRVPILLVRERGPNWGETKADWQQTSTLSQ